jgi:hypothetical protein
MTLRKVSLAGIAIFFALSGFLSWGPSRAAAQQRELPRAEDFIGVYISDIDKTTSRNIEQAIKAWLVNRNMNEARGALMQAKADNSKLPPVEIMMAQLLAMTNNGQQARAELEEGVYRPRTIPSFTSSLGISPFRSAA